MLTVVANEDGFATGVPFFAVTVAFSVVSTDPVELIFAACEKVAVSNQTVQDMNFMMTL